MCYKWGGCYGIWDLGFEGLKFLGFGDLGGKIIWDLGFGENIWDLGFEVLKSIYSSVIRPLILDDSQLLLKIKYRSHIT